MPETVKRSLRKFDDHTGINRQGCATVDGYVAGHAIGAVCQSPSSV